ncbi:hypothetical protein M3Y99_01095900 [Aphelenchoides fujianensis]|nr:hypothetical protein M3Y99_01095900 [Aphelenchoides fujianensis]
MRPPSERAKRMEEKKAERERRENEAMKQEEEEREVRRQRRAKQLGRLENSSTTHDDSHDSMDDVKDERFDVIEIDDEAPAHHHPKTEPVDPTVPREVYFICFFCGSVLDDPSDFVNHMEHHLEHFDRCPICVAQGKNQTLKHSLHLIDHLLEMHMRSQDDRIECPTCRLSFGDMRFRENFYLGFKHVLFDCSSLGFCTICLAAKDGQKIPLRPENSKKHFNWAHPHIYNRFLCTVLHDGLPDAHRCSLTIRCNCDLTASFPSIDEYFQHRRLGQQDHCQMLQKMSHDTPAIFVPGELRKTLEAARVAAYPILRLFKEDLPEDVQSQPPFRRTLPVHGPAFTATGEGTSQIGGAIARKYASGGRSISPAVPEAKPAITPATQSAVVQKAPLKEPSLLGPGESQTADEKALAARSKAKRKRGADEQPKPKAIKLQEAHAERSDVWKWAEKLGGDLEVAACLEDLVFLGIGRELTPKVREPKREPPVQPPAAPVAISSSALPLPKKIVLKLAPRPNFILRKFAAVPPNAHARPEANGMRVQPPPPIARRSPSEEDDEIQVVGVRPAPHPVDVIYVE